MRFSPLGPGIGDDEDDCVIVGVLIVCTPAVGGPVVVGIVCAVDVDAR